eukprot:TRINITY_DN1145_c0_g1_i2.p1 TRINITY_DN1145_c0_g1~~TRINITY_DN1145_c0_g1_i2.p1  ORF type:complete len:199 (-),score=31.50 TRINITY_DN1145_c0_g1_i2:150-746(-)
MWNAVYLSEDEMWNAVTTSLQCLPSTQHRMFVVSKILTQTRRDHKKNNVKDLYRFIKALVSCLSYKDQEELNTILLGLPPSVLGDQEAREQTRVFVDIHHDIRQALMFSSNSSVPEIKEDESVCKILVFIQNQFDSVPPVSQIALCQTLLGVLDDGDKFMMVMSHLLLSQVLSPQIDERQTLFQYLFGSTGGEKRPQI